MHQPHALWKNASTVYKEGLAGVDQSDFVKYVIIMDCSTETNRTLLNGIFQNCRRKWTVYKEGLAGVGQSHFVNSMTMGFFKIVEGNGYAPVLDSSELCILLRLFPKRQQGRVSLKLYPCLLAIINLMYLHFLTEQLHRNLPLKESQLVELLVELATCHLLSSTVCIVT